MTDWILRFMKLAEHISGWSKDPSTKVGAVIVDGKRIVSLGFNGPPQHTKDGEFTRDEKLLRTLHAEENALLFAGSVEGCDIYTTHPPCAHCTAMLIQSGIRRIYFRCAAPDFLTRWADHIGASNAMCEEAGVKLIGVALV